MCITASVVAYKDAVQEKPVGSTTRRVRPAKQSTGPSLGLRLQDSRVGLCSEEAAPISAFADAPEDVEHAAVPPPPVDITPGAVAPGHNFGASDTEASPPAKKPRKKQKAPIKERVGAPELSSQPSDASTALVISTPRKKKKKKSDADASTVAKQRVINQFDEMRKSLLPKRRKRKVKESQDSSAPLDPTSMTLNDLIWHAHSHATAKEQQYQKALAEKKKREAADTEKKQAGMQSTAVEKVPVAPVEPDPSAAGASFAPRLVMRDGQIVVDERSLTIQSQRKTVLEREVEEDDGDVLINSHSYLPLSKLTKERWAKDETDLFYQILRSYGADFTFMAQCFRGRTRKQVKNKYLKEQRINPKRVHEAMTARDVDMLKHLSEMAQNGDCSQAGRPLLTAAPDTGGDACPGEQGDDDLEAEMCGEDENPGRNAFFY